MKLLFLTISPLQRINYSGIYTDLMRKFRDEGHDVYIVSSVERRLAIPTNYAHIDGVHILSVKTLNLQKTNVVEKGVGQLLVESQYKTAIKRYLCGISFDLILYTTPPITIPGVIKYLKRMNPQAKTYLLLKDIFPQNALDLGLLSKRGIKGFLYKKFRKKEVAIYELSDHIGCMSPANVEYLIKHNPFIDKSRVEVAPNSYERVEYVPQPEESRKVIRKKYGLPENKVVFIYGGNLGKPQGIPFLIDCLKALKDDETVVEGSHFLIIGKGTEKEKLDAWIADTNPSNVTIMEFIPKEDYDQLAQACDVGLIFLDHRFTIPNYPSRLLSYLKQKKPIIAATDPNTDIGSIAVKNGYGFACESHNAKAFVQCVHRFLNTPDSIRTMGENGYRFYLENYTVEETYNAIMSHV